MKKYQYVVAFTCLALGAAGFVGLYMTNQTEEEPAKNQNIVQESEDIILGSDIFEDKDIDTEDQLAEKDEDATIEDEQDFPSADDEVDSDAELNQELVQKDTVDDEAPVGTITQEALHFNPENGLVWPIEGTVLLDYSMDSTIFFPTLQQYQYNPAMIFAGKVNDKVYFVAKGKTQA